MAIESSGHSQGNPRMFELIEGAPKTGKSPTIWAWPQITEYLKVAGQPVAGPWPPHQEPRPDPEEDTLPVAVAESPRPTNRPVQAPAAPRQAPAQASPRQAPAQASPRQAPAQASGPRHAQAVAEEPEPGDPGSHVPKGLR